MVIGQVLASKTERRWRMNFGASPYDPNPQGSPRERPWGGVYGAPTTQPELQAGSPHRVQTQLSPGLPMTPMPDSIASSVARRTAAQSPRGPFQSIKANAVDQQQTPPARHTTNDNNVVENDDYRTGVGSSKSFGHRTPSAARNVSVEEAIGDAIRAGRSCSEIGQTAREAVFRTGVPQPEASYVAGRAGEEANGIVAAASQAAVAAGLWGDEGKLMATE
eukprot:CAMPEP_0114502406 /NCGR_PEP_ID=MMETSP0109-20121206/9075_1 /TAXON_ID=29199 /ORGANISM="Chlorarachnion reptans, Strain CCCM449" /LENGTH=219 /DNA_ID=CAMNT_0001680321 /DNA_START=131 /DNA_END=787 /DNA_ORIENTATION=+